MTVASTTKITAELLGKWAADPAGPVALRLRQRLLPVTADEGEPGIIYPPTYADIGYCVDTLSDDTQVALIDSVGSQANRMEPIFKERFSAEGTTAKAEHLVPPIEIVLGTEKPKKPEKGREQAQPERRSLLDLAHRSADAVVQSCPDLKKLFDRAFESLHQGDASPLCALAPTSLVFGVWDSRGGSGEKRPRLVRAVIRAWDVDVLHSAAQFNSVWKALTEEQRGELEKATPKGVKLSEKGFKDAPAVFRPKMKLPRYVDGAPNTEARVLGGILVRDQGRIERDVTVNLVALRNLRGTSVEESGKIQRYLLGLTLLAAMQEIDLFLREGCHLRYAEAEDDWRVVPRRGEPTRTDLGSAAARAVVREFTLAAAEPFRTRWPKEFEYQFDLAEAKKLLVKKDDEPQGEE